MFLLHPQIEPWLVRHPRGCTLSLLTERSDEVTVQLRCEPDNEGRFIAMQPAGRQAALHRFEAELPWDEGNESTVYCFRVIEKGRQYWLAADGPHPRVPHREVMFRVHPKQTPPPWVRDQVFYQIFPDRFCQGDPALQVRTDEYVYGSGRLRVKARRWGEPVDRAHGATEFFGGDLVGVRNRLDYLQNELGVTALYLNPIFRSGSNHKYDTEDYYQVDPHLGGNTVFAELAADLRTRGMRLVLDAVVNHTAVDHPWFNLYRRHANHGAANGTDSPYRTWYTFDACGRHAGWNGHASLPVLDFSTQAVREQVYAGPNAILRHWMRPPYSIDGWRFDVIHMLGEGKGSINNAHYVRAFRQTLREENPQAYVLGEHFNEATRWLQGDQEDGAMNYYGFAHPVREWLASTDITHMPAQLSTEDFSAWLDSARGHIPYDNQLAQLNLLDSHDTARFLSLLKGDVKAMKLAVTLLFAYPGVPCVYYGDEVGMEGWQDPDCRRCFDWERSHWNQDLFSHYRGLIALRKEREELRHGAYQALVAHGDAFVFARHGANGASIFAFNRRKEACAVQVPVWQIPVAAHWHRVEGEAMDSDKCWITLPLPPCSSVILLGTPQG